MRLIGILTLGGALAAAAPADVAQEQRTPAALAARAATYVAAYQAAFAFLVADESYVQEAIWIDGPQEAAPRRRVMRGELFLTYLAADRRWVALHDVAEVDGEPVTGREELRALLAVSSAQSVAARLFRHNSRYNLGTVSRNFNEPTLPLQVFEARHRSRFQFSVADGQDKAPVVTLQFRERDRPTLVGALDGGPVFSSGEVVLDVATGTIRQTRIAFRRGAVQAELSTIYEHDPRLDLYLPTVFLERYRADPRDGRPAELITGDARYTNYRRFEARGRVEAREK